jgi:hypothetical protein
MKKNYLTTLSQRLDQLRKEGYTEDFNLHPDCLHCQEGKFILYPDDFKIDIFYRFEGESDPADAAILYGISSEKHKLKGVLVNGYGISADPLTNEMIKKLSTHE